MTGIVVVIMGVTGCGKSTVGTQLAAVNGGCFIEGDDFHTQENKLKMAEGIPLTDADRLPWLQALSAAATAEAMKNQLVVVACSALARRYRDVLRREVGATVRFVHLAIPREDIERRLASRANHFAGSSLLDSQYAVLEVPEVTTEPDATVVFVAEAMAVADVLASLACVSTCV
ncbi:hypothetical protein HDU84_008129 [Entophlyctis sp. JEL0112]|nr:hypothetical protein HDU84_008129 [Entophlyctis sp. JEL0112]